VALAKNISYNVGRIADGLVFAVLSADIKAKLELKS
jgi:hypothetical protein